MLVTKVSDVFYNVQLLTRSCILVLSNLTISLACADNDFSLKDKNAINLPDETVFISGRQLGIVSYSRFPKLENAIVKVDFKNKKITKIPNGWGSSGATRTLLMSSDNTKLYFLHITANPTANFSLYFLDIDNENETRKIADSVTYYDSSPDGMSIVYIKGDLYGFTNNTPFRSDGLYIYDIKNDTTKKIAKTAYQVSWEKFDNNIYYDKAGLYENEIFQYDTKKKIETKTEYKGLNFSKDGKHYCNIVSMDEMPVYPEIRDAKTQAVVFDMSGLNTSDCAWMGDSKILVTWVTELLVFDVLKKKKIFSAPSIDSQRIIASRNGKYVIYKEGEWQLWDIATKKMISSVKNTLFKDMSFEEHLKQRKQ